MPPSVLAQGFGVDTPRRISLLDLYPSEPRTRPVESEGPSPEELEVVREEMVETWRSLRKRGEPQTIVHALVLRDGLSLGRLAAQARLDIPEAQDRLIALEATGVVVAQYDDDGYALYRLAGL